MEIPICSHKFWHDTAQILHLKNDNKNFFKKKPTTWLQPAMMRVQSQKKKR